MANTTKTYKFTNTGAAAGNFTVAIPEYENLTYVSHTLTAGTYDALGFSWTIPNMDPGEEETLVITYSVEYNTSCASGPCTGDCTQPTANPVDIEVPPPSVFQGCIPQSSYCTCGSQEVAVSNQVNVTVTMDNAGQYTAIVTNPLLPWSFDYTITCILNETTYGPFGPGTISSDGAADTEPVVELFTFTGGETSVTVVATMPTNNANVTVSRMGLELYETIDYTISGQNINLVSPGIVGETLKVKLEY